jgi:hypothetical protein
MVSTLTCGVSDSLRRKVDSCKGFALELDGECDEEKIYSADLVGSLEDGCIDAEVVKACCVYLRTYCPLSPLGAKLSLCDGDEEEEKEEVQISTAAFTPMLMSFGRYVVAFDTLAKADSPERDWQLMIQHVVPLFTAWVDASREVAEVHAIASLADEVNEGLDVSKAAVEVMIKDLVKSVGGIAEAVGTLLSSEELQELGALVQSDCVEPHMVKFNKIVACKPARDMYFMFKAYDHESAMLTSLQCELRNVKLVVSSLATTVEKLIELAHCEDDAFVKLMERGGRALGNLIVVQAMFRALQTGETRAGLAKKCIKCVSRSKFLSLDPKIDMMLVGMSRDKGMLANASAAAASAASGCEGASSLA